MSGLSCLANLLWAGCKSLLGVCLQAHHPTNRKVGQILSFLPWAISSNKAMLWPDAVPLPEVTGTCWAAQVDRAHTQRLSCKTQLQTLSGGWIYACLGALVLAPARSLALFPAARTGDECTNVSALLQTLLLLGDWREGAAEGEGWGGEENNSWWKTVGFGSQNLSRPTSWLMQCVERRSSSPLGLWVSSQPRPRRFPKRFRWLSPSAAWQEPAGSTTLAWLPFRAVPSGARVRACFWMLEDFSSPMSSFLSWKQLFNIPMPSSALQQSVGLICIIKPFWKTLSWSNLVGK